MTVTALKREQSVEDIDSAVSVRSGEQLREAGVTQVQQLEKVFPGLVVRPRGSRAYTSITARGMAATDYYSPTVQLYVDGVPQENSFLDQELVNIERVEYLRGPQGTLYGKSAYGGVINIVTSKPREQQTRASVTAGYPIYGVEASNTSVLVEDALFADIAVRGSRNEGQIRDADLNRSGIDRSRVVSGRANLRYAPSDKPFDVTLSVAHEYLHSNEERYILDDNLDKKRFFGEGQGRDPEFDRNVTTGSLAFNYDFGDVTLSNVTSVQYVDLDRRIVLDTPEKSTALYEELRLAYDGGGALTGVAGLAAYGQWFERDTEAFPGFLGSSHNKVDTSGIALFGEGTYALTSRLDLTLGARFAYDHAKVDFDQNDPGGYDFDGSDDFTSVQPKVALGYQLTDETRIYGLVSQGYKPGGFNRSVSTPADAESYDDETAWNFELGGRTRTFGDKLELGAALYYIRSEDKQIFVGPVGAQVIENVGDGESYGVELEAAYYPTDQLTLTANAAYGRSEMKNADDPATGEDFDGNTLPYAPDFVGTLAANYLIEQSYLPGDVSLYGAVNGFSKTYFDTANDLEQPAFATFDTAINLALDNGVSLRLFAENLMDKVYRTSTFDFGGGVIQSTIGQGRVVGLTLSAAF